MSSNGARQRREPVAAEKPTHVGRKSTATSSQARDSEARGTATVVARTRTMARRAAHDTSRGANAQQTEARSGRRSAPLPADGEKKHRTAEEEQEKQKSTKRRDDADKNGGGDGDGGTAKSGDDAVKKTDTLNVLMHAAVGAVGAVAYRASARYQQETYAVNHLVPTPFAFTVAPEAYHFFGEFTRLRRHYPEMYLAAFHATDWILNLERVLATHCAQPTDEARCFAHRSVASTCARALCDRYLENIANAAAPQVATPPSSSSSSSSTAVLPPVSALSQTSPPATSKLDLERRTVTELTEGFDAFLTKRMVRVRLLCNSEYSVANRDDGADDGDGSPLARDAADFVRELDREAALAARSAPSDTKSSRTPRLAPPPPPPPPAPTSGLLELALYAVAGAAAGVLYRAVTTSGDDDARALSVDARLRPTPYAFEVAPDAYRFFAEFSRLRKHDSHSYLGAFHATDWMLNLERVLAADLDPAQPDDESRCFAHQCVASACAQKLCEQYLANYESRDSRVVAQERRRVTDLADRFDAFLAARMLRVTSLCNRIAQT